MKMLKCKILLEHESDARALVINERVAATGVLVCRITANFRTKTQLNVIIMDEIGMMDVRCATIFGPRKTLPCRFQI